MLYFVYPLLISFFLEIFIDCINFKLFPISDLHITIEMLMNGRSCLPRLIPKENIVIVDDALLIHLSLRKGLIFHHQTAKRGFFRLFRFHFESHERFGISSGWFWLYNCVGHGNMFNCLSWLLMLLCIYPNRILLLLLFVLRKYIHLIALTLWLLAES